MSSQDYQSKYLTRARRAATLLKLIPQILLVGVSGSLCNNKATSKSDIDFFVVCRAGRIFSCRFFAKLILLFWARKNHDLKPAGKICLNYFLSEESLDFKPHSSKVVKYYQKSIILFSRGDILSRLTRANLWLKPKFELKHHHNYPRRSKTNCFSSWLEKRLKCIQIRLIKKDPLTARFPDKIIFNDLELRFHPPREPRLG